MPLVSSNTLIARDSASTAARTTHSSPKAAQFHRHLTALGYPHHYAQHPGAHTWAYWDEHVREAIRQHLAVLAQRD